MVPADSATRNGRADDYTASITKGDDRRHHRGRPRQRLEKVGVLAVSRWMRREDSALALGETPASLERHSRHYRQADRLPIRPRAQRLSLPFLDTARGNRLGGRFSRSSQRSIATMTWDRTLSLPVPRHRGRSSHRRARPGVFQQLADRIHRFQSL